MGKNKKRLRKSVTESYLPKKIKVEKDRQPIRFSKRIRKMTPSFTSYSEILRNPVKYIKTEKGIGEHGKPVLNQDSSAQFIQPRATRRKIRYPPKVHNSKEIFNILSAPKMNGVNSKHQPKSKNHENQFNVQVRGSTFKSKVSVKKQKYPVENVLTVSKTCAFHKPQLIHNRKKYVLEILNKGDQKEIEKLHSVGSKTAERILLFRQLKGTISKISELTLMPKFTKSKFNNFVQQNFLKTS